MFHDYKWQKKMILWDSYMSNDVSVNVYAFGRPLIKSDVFAKYIIPDIPTQEN